MDRGSVPLFLYFLRVHHGKSCGLLRDAYPRTTLTDHLSEGVRKIVDFIGNFVQMAFFLTASGAGLSLVADMVEYPVFSTSLLLPLYYIYFIIPLSYFLMAVREKLKVTLIVLSNDVLGYVKTSEMLRYGKNSTSVFMAPIDHVALAKACGFDAIHVDTPEEMEAALKLAAASEKPFLIEAKCTDNCPPITDFVGR